MFSEMSGTWMFIVLIESCAGSAMALYGWKQKEPVPLAFGVVLTLLPYFVRSAWLAGLSGLAVMALFFALRKSLDW